MMSHNIYYGKYLAFRVALRVWQFDDEAILAGFDSARQFGTEFSVIKALIHVGQHGAPWTHALDPRYCLCEMRMRRMRLAPQAIDDPQLDPGDRGEGCVVEFVRVSRVAEAADTKTERRAEPVVLRKRHDRDPGDLERAADLVWLEGRFVEPSR